MIEYRQTLSISNKVSLTNDGTNNALGFELYTPQIGASYNYTPENFIFFKK